MSVDGFCYNIFRQVTEGCDDEELMMTHGIIIQIFFSIHYPPKWLPHNPGAIKSNIPFKPAVKTPVTVILNSKSRASPVIFTLIYRLVIDT